MHGYLLQTESLQHKVKVEVQVKIWSKHRPNLRVIHDDINLCRFVIPGLTRNPVFSWIPSFEGMTSSVVINGAVYRRKFLD